MADKSGAGSASGASFAQAASGRKSARPSAGKPSARPSAGKPSAHPNSGSAAEIPYESNAPAAAQAVSDPFANPKRSKNDPNRVRFFEVKRKVDVPMLIIVLVLLVFGLTMMFSAGYAQSLSAAEASDNNDPYQLIKTQLGAAIVGLVAMVFLSVFDYRFLRYEFRIKSFRITVAHILFAVGIVLTSLCIPFGVSNTEGGPRRWLRLPIFKRFQPSDILKLALIIFFAYYIHKHAKVIRRFFYGWMIPGAIFVVVGFVMMMQPHLSGFVIMFAIIACMLFVGGINIKPALWVSVLAAAVILLLIVISGYEYFADRLEYMDPLSDPTGKSYQSYQAVLAIGSGGFWGVGFGNSTQKYNYLPEAQNDFVFAVLCEELGFVGGFFLILLFLIFTLRGFYIARKADDRFGMLLATGITFHIGLQVLLNIGVNVCCIPNTGISMPFFSYGGTALLLQMVEMGLLLSVSKRSKLN